MEERTKKIIIGVVAALLVIGAVLGIALPIYFNADSIKKAFKGNGLYTYDDITAARDRGFKDNIEELDYYRSMVKYLEAENIRIKEEAKAEYDAMVAYYTGIIEKLEKELASQIDFSTGLNEITIDLAKKLVGIDGSDRDVIELLVELLESYEAAKLEEMRKARMQLDDLPNLAELEAERQGTLEAIAALDGEIYLLQHELDVAANIAELLLEVLFVPTIEGNKYMGAALDSSKLSSFRMDGDSTYWTFFYYNIGMRHFYLDPKSDMFLNMNEPFNIGTPDNRQSNYTSTLFGGFMLGDWAKLYFYDKYSALGYDCSNVFINQTERARSGGNYDVYMRYLSEFTTDKYGKEATREAFVGTEISQQERIDWVIKRQSEINFEIDVLDGSLDLIRKDLSKYKAMLEAEGANK